MHHIDSAIDQLLISVEAEKHILRLDLHLRAVDLAELLQAGVDAILINIGDGGQFGIIIGFESLRSGSSAAPSAADQADFNRVGGLTTDQRREPGGEGGSRSLQEITAVVLLHFVSVVRRSSVVAITDRRDPSPSSCREGRSSRFSAH